MNCVGVVVEYNPFHNGHLYHLRKTRQLIKTDAIIAVMSGNFVQRGEPALINKWARAEMALKQGVDLVIELPFIWATQSAGNFSKGAVSILNATGLVNYQTFGSETADLDFLKEAAIMLNQEPEKFKHELKKYLKKGNSYPRAINKALNNLTNSDKKLTPNDILGVEYLKSHQSLKTGITPLIIKRSGSGYHDKNLDSNLSSATAIREAIIEAKDINNYVPETTLEILRAHSNSFVFFNDLEKYIIYRLRTASLQELLSYTGWEEGLENRLKKAAVYHTELNSIINYTITRRYTRGRINRYLIHLLVGLTREKISVFNKKGPSYIRILGMNSSGRSLIKKMKDTANLPVLTRPAKELRKLDSYAENCFYQEVISTSFYNLLIDREGHDDYTRPAVML